MWFYNRDQTTLRELLNAELKVALKDEGVDCDLGEDKL